MINKLPRKQKKEIIKIEGLWKGWNSATSNDFMYKNNIKKNKYTLKLENTFTRSKNIKNYIIDYGKITKRI